MTNSTNKTQKAHRRANQQAEQDQFRQQLRGYRAIIGIPHWQLDTPISRETIDHYVNRGSVIRSNTFRNAIGTGFKWLAAKVKGARDIYLVSRKHRQNALVLNGLNDRTLKDIGVTRGEIFGYTNGRISLDDLNHRGSRKVKSPVQVSNVVTLSKSKDITEIAACNHAELDNVA